MPAKLCVSNKFSDSYKVSLRKWNFIACKITARRQKQWTYSFWPRDDENLPQTMLYSFWLLLPPSSASRLRQSQPALGRVLACNESQVRELFSKSRDQKELGFVPVVLPGMTEDSAAAAHPASSPTPADSLAGHLWQSHWYCFQRGKWLLNKEVLES